MNHHKKSLIWSAVPTLFDVPNPPKTLATKRPLPTERHTLPPKVCKKGDQLIHIHVGQSFFFKFMFIMLILKINICVQMTV